MIERMLRGGNVRVRDQLALALLTAVAAAGFSGVAHSESANPPPLSISGPGGLEAQLQGRVIIDFGTPFNRDIPPDAAVQTFGGGAKFAATRLGVKGVFAGDWSFDFTYDFTDSGAAGIKWAYVSYNGFRPFGASTSIVLGNQHVPGGFEGQESTKYLTFIGQSVPFSAITVGPRHLGLSWNGLRGPLQWRLGVFGEVPGDEIDTAAGSQGIDVGGQFQYTPLMRRGQFIQLGISSIYHRYNGEIGIGNHNDAVLKAEAALKAASGLLPGLISASDASITPNHMTLNTASAVWENHSLSGAVEYYWDHASGLESDTPLVSDTASFHGYYGQIGWFVTGETRPFHRSPMENLFVGVHPEHPVGQGGYGAWEIAFRYSEADLNTAVISGGEERDATFALNWIPVYHLREQLDVTRTFPIRGGKNAGVSFYSVMARTVFFF